MRRPLLHIRKQRRRSAVFAIIYNSIHLLPKSKMPKLYLLWLYGPVCVGSDRKTDFLMKKLILLFPCISLIFITQDRVINNIFCDQK